MILDYINLLRPKQWYKNLLIFFALFFSSNLFNIKLLSLTAYGFLLLIVVSAAGYIINDVVDYKKDRKNPEKKKRPIASGKISRTLAIIISLVLYLSGFILSWVLSPLFFAVLLALAISTFVYTLHFKNVVFADIIFIGLNFVLRALSGVVLIGVILSPWFLLGVLSLAFFLVAGKRYGDISLMGRKSSDYKPVLKHYSKELLNTLLIIFTTFMLVIYGFYAFSINKQELFLLYPFFMFILFRYYYHIINEKDAVRNPEDFIFKKRDWYMIGSSILFVLGFYLIYYGGFVI